MSSLNYSARPALDISNYVVTGLYKSLHGDYVWWEKVGLRRQRSDVTALNP